MLIASFVGERLGLLALHGVERRPGLGERVHQGRHYHAGGACLRRRPARRVLGQ